jgi:hypothetical protein
MAANITIHQLNTLGSLSGTEVFPLETSPNYATFKSNVSSLVPYLSLQTFSKLNTSGQVTSSVTTGTAPFVVASQTLVANLYAARSALADSVTSGLYTTSTFSSVPGSDATVTGTSSTINVALNSIVSPGVVGGLITTVSGSRTVSAVVVPQVVYNAKGQVTAAGNLQINTPLFNGMTVYGDVLPTTASAVNVGSSSLPFNNLYASAIQSSTAAFSQVTISQSLQPQANASINLGSTSAWWNTIYGTAIHAQYADLAECYQSDQYYPPGTVVVFGTDTEITQSTSHMDTRVAGVVSTNPAYLMNQGGGLPVALQGRVPCRVVGPVRRGDMLVTSSIPGVAQSQAGPILGSVIGKALENYTEQGVGTIEVVVGRL